MSAVDRRSGGRNASHRLLIFQEALRAPRARRGV